MQDLAARLESRLHQNLAADAHGAEIASRVVALWQDLAATFVPIVGKRGFSALVRRSLSISVVKFPWLSVALTEPPADDELPGLHHALGGRSGADATEANAALLGNFLDLLANLIGAPLTDRLLRQALDLSPGAAAPQENPR